MDDDVRGPEVFDHPGDDVDLPPRPVRAGVQQHPAGKKPSEVFVRARQTILCILSFLFLSKRTRASFSLKLIK